MARRRSYKRTYRRGRGRRKRYNYRRRKASARKRIQLYAARQSARKFALRKAIMNAMQVEKKYFRSSTVVADTAIGTTGVINHAMSLVPIGDGESARIGKKISVSKVTVKAVFLPHMLNDRWQLPNGGGGTSLSVPSTPRFRFQLWIDTQPNVTEAVTTTQLYAGYDNTKDNNYALFRERDQASRFRLLKTYHVVMHPTVAIATVPDDTTSPYDTFFVYTYASPIVTGKQSIIIIFSVIITSI